MNWVIGILEYLSLVYWTWISGSRSVNVRSMDSPHLNLQGLCAATVGVWLCKREVSPPRGWLHTWCHSPSPPLPLCGGEGGGLHPAREGPAAGRRARYGSGWVDCYMHAHTSSWRMLSLKHDSHISRLTWGFWTLIAILIFQVSTLMDWSRSPLNLRITMPRQRWDSYCFIFHLFVRWLASDLACRN